MPLITRSPAQLLQFSHSPHTLGDVFLLNNPRKTMLIPIGGFTASKLR